MSFRHGTSDSKGSATSGNEAADSGSPVRRNSYSRKRWNAFESWQEHVRRSAADIGVAFQAKPDRDLRRVSITG